METDNTSRLAAMNKFWNESPSQAIRSKKVPGSKEFFDEIEWRRYVLETHIKPWAKFETYKDKKVLEVGCGMGTDTMQFARAGAIITAVDYSNESLELLKKRIALEGHTHVTTYHANAEELSKTVPVQAYDLIYSFGVLHHTPNPERAYREITKYMDKHTVFKLMVYHAYSLKTLGVMLMHGPRNWRKKVEYYSEHTDGSPVTYVYTKKEISALLEKCGMRVIDIQVRYLWMRWYLKWIPKPVLTWIDHTFGWNICVEAMLQ